jgi:hypothetical protein
MSATKKELANVKKMLPQKRISRENWLPLQKGPPTERKWWATKKQDKSMVTENRGQIQTHRGQRIRIESSSQTKKNWQLNKIKTNQSLLAVT